MPSDRDSWIVLLNKSPHGPFTEDVIKVLLEQGVVRINDVAFKVPTGPDKTQSEWKFLWQFSQFDRRLGRPAPAGDPTAPVISPAEAERRKQASELEAKKKAQSALPLDLVDISPEELIVRSSPSQPTHTRHHEAPVEVSLPRHGGSPSGGYSGGHHRWTLAAGFIVLVVTTTLILFRRTPLVSAPPSAPVTDSAPDTRSPAVSRGPLDGAIAPRRNSPLPAQAPRARDREPERDRPSEVDDPHLAEQDDIDEGDEGVPPVKDRDLAEDNEDSEGRVMDVPAFKRAGPKPKRAKGWEGARKDDEGQIDEPADEDEGLD